MAKIIDVTNLTLNPKESGDFGKFIVELAFNNPAIKAMHTIFEGVTMKSQIVLASQLGLTGKKANGCARQTTGAKSTLTQKYWEPVVIEDTLTNCQSEVNALFKAYYDKIKSYKELYNIEGSDEQLFIASLVEQSMNDTVLRAIWYGDTEVAAATEDTPGLIDGDNAYAFNYFDGLLKQIYAGVATGETPRVDISDLQDEKLVSASEAYKAFMDVYKSADPRMRSSQEAKFYVDDQMFLGLCEYLQTESVNWTLDYTFNGFPVVKFLGHDVINMGGIFDKNDQYFEKSTEGGAYLQHKIVFTIPANIPVATLNEDDMTSLESWYNQDDRVNKIAYGFSLDAKVIDPKLVVIAY